ncbi:hypothetical protein MPLB_2040021 [Mesorhizobium sp. ORS 3324]|nr:hypothetical protein MPLB_2040021 [Mesorhizobium sp. ORS 3324]
MSREPSTGSCCGRRLSVRLAPCPLVRSLPERGLERLCSAVFLVICLHALSRLASSLGWLRADLLRASQTDGLSICSGNPAQSEDDAKQQFAPSPFDKAHPGEDAGRLVAAERGDGVSGTLSHLDGQNP